VKLPESIDELHSALNLDHIIYVNWLGPLIQNRLRTLVIEHAQRRSKTQSFLHIWLSLVPCQYWSRSRQTMFCTLKTVIRIASDFELVEGAKVSWCQAVAAGAKTAAMQPWTQLVPV